MVTGFAPRRRELVFYLMTGLERHAAAAGRGWARTAPASPASTCAAWPTSTWPCWRRWCVTASRRWRPGAWTWSAAHEGRRRAPPRDLVGRPTAAACTSSTSAGCRMSCSVARLAGVADAVTAIRDMWVRGAPLIGVTAAYGLALQARADAVDAALDAAAAAAGGGAADGRQPGLGGAARARRAAARCRRPSVPRRPGRWPARMADEDVAINEAIGRHGLPLLQAVAERARRARLERADALQRRLAGHRRLGHRHWRRSTRRRRPGIDVHVWVDETRPRNQGASLTAWELAAAGRAAHRDRRQRRRPPDAARPGRPGHRRLRPRHRARRRLQQDRHLPEGAGGARQRRAVLCRDAAVDAGPEPATTACARSRSRSAPRARSRTSSGRSRRRPAGRGAARARRHGGRQPGLRRHAGAPGHRPDHRARPWWPADARRWRRLASRRRAQGDGVEPKPTRAPPWSTPCGGSTRWA